MSGQIGRRVVAWIGPRKDQEGIIERVYGERHVVVRWADGVSETYAGADLIDVALIWSWAEERQS